MIHFLFKEIFVQRSYDFKAKTNTPFIIDAGSNIGMSILYFKMIYPHAKIIGFEPDDATFDILEKNINNNKLTDVKLYKKALSNKQGFISFFYDKNTPGGLGASIVSHGPCEKKVESDTLSHFITQPVDLLKIDIEAGLCPN
jgi:FkbM family methyltransferase